MSYQDWSKNRNYKNGIPSATPLSNILGSWRNQLQNKAVLERRFAIVTAFRERLTESIATDETDSDESYIVDNTNKRQKRRGSMSNHMISTYEEIYSTPNVLASISSEKREGHKPNEALFKNMMYLPLHFIDIPPDIHNGEWLFCTRPEGSIAHAIIRNGRAIVRGKSGRTLRWGPVKAYPRNTTILYGIYSERNFYAFDVLMWNNMSLCEFEMNSRLSFVMSRMEEIDILSKNKQMVHRPCSADLTIVNNFSEWKVVNKRNFCSEYDEAHNKLISGENYEKDKGIIPDGLWFMHGDAYHLPGLSPSFLHFKDDKICRWPIDTEPIPNAETGKYEPAHTMKIRLWVSTEETRNAEWDGDDDQSRVYKDAEEDVAYSAEGVPILKIDGLSECLGNRPYGVVSFECSDFLEFSGDINFPFIFKDIRIIRHPSKNIKAAALCQNVDADSISKILYLGKARQLHFHNVDGVLSGIHIFQSLGDNEETSNETQHAMP